MWFKIALADSSSSASSPSPTSATGVLGNILIRIFIFLPPPNLSSLVCSSSSGPSPIFSATIFRQTRGEEQHEIMSTHQVQQKNASPWMAIRKNAIFEKRQLPNRPQNEAKTTLPEHLP